ncbi:MIEF1 upstream open reading frame protein [Copidosoma floridanum]|uniref:MIEF1 upstream open reading frame protein n=1 Tax=Copidosoma floridanum TaxID=29053 RepID=UPI0006C9C39B|nr:MIEF1 upstream open reading frame protein [Copidosoma floridanum]
MVKMHQYEILGLYKSLLRYSQNLKYTDPKYFVHRVRRAFLNNRNLTHEKDINFQYEKGLALLRRKRVV